MSAHQRRSAAIAAVVIVLGAIALVGCDHRRTADDGPADRAPLVLEVRDLHDLPAPAHQSWCAPRPTAACGLRDALAVANRTEGPTTIELPRGTIQRWAGGPLLVRGDIAIEGQGQGASILAGNGASKLFRLAPHAHLRLTHLALAGGDEAAPTHLRGAVVDLRDVTTAAQVTDLATSDLRAVTSACSFVGPATGQPVRRATLADSQGLWVLPGGIA